MQIAFEFKQGFEEVKECSCMPLGKSLVEREVQLGV